MARCVSNICPDFGDLMQCDILLSPSLTLPKRPFTPKRGERNKQTSVPVIDLLVPLALLDGTPPPSPASPSARQAGDDDVAEADDGGDDGLQDGTDAVHDGH
ncbi:hypothetical protein MMC08_001771 [Hypocenomyce scalaris]|nr:hypothetical protein [Hypocenomyce scalaris]